MDRLKAEAGADPMPLPQPLLRADEEPVPTPDEEAWNAEDSTPNDITRDAEDDLTTVDRGEDVPPLT